MTISIGNNIASLRAQRKLAGSTETLNRVNERLASGQRINRAADDAAGLAIADSLRADGRVFSQGIKNLNDGLSLLNIADSALAQLTGISIRHKELATQSANGILGNQQRQALDEEANALVDEFNRIIETTEFNGRKILRSDFGELRLQAGYGIAGSVALSLNATTATAPTFQVAATYDTGQNPRDLELADLNNDGEVDLIVSNRDSADITVRLGLGGGTFGQAVTYASGIESRTLDAGDLNGDGALDVIVAAPSDEDVIVYLGNGDGSLSTGVAYAMQGVVSATLADLNGDTILDMAASDLIGDAVNIRLGVGNGTFGGSTSLDAGDITFDVDAADLDGNGTIDLVASNRGSNDLTVHLGNGDGSFLGAVTYAAVTGVRNFAIGDVNGDGASDLVAISPEDDEVGILLGLGDGSFGPVATYSALASAFTPDLGDLNEDGLLDLVIAGGDSLLYRLGNGDGTFGSQASVVAGDNVNNLRLADIDHDSALDIVAVSGASNEVVVAFGTPTPKLVATTMDLTSQDSALTELEIIDSRLARVNSTRATIGAYQSRINTAIRNLATAQENYAGAESRIRDTDVAADAAEATSVAILQQAGAAVLAQANQQPAIALQLLGS